MTYSLLLHSLDPKPTRQELEEISAKVPSVARADCAYMLEDWFGIVAGGLPADEAKAFQTALRENGIATDVVPDHGIPSLHNDFRCQRIDLTGSTITLTTAMNRRQARDKGELVFLSAGFVDREKSRSTTEIHQEIRWSTYGPYRAKTERSVMKFEEKRFFRVDLFFSSDPFRISLEIEKETLLFYGDRPIRMKNPLDLTVLMVDLQALLPAPRMNRALRNLTLDAVYPSLHAYEEELRWSFYRLDAKG